MVLFAEAFVWVPKYTKDTLFISAVSVNDACPQRTMCPLSTDVPLNQANGLWLYGHWAHIRLSARSFRRVLTITIY